ncbi:BglG family transcription antiterminator LicT [Floccifex sp.]|uniref:BglG family transcription antiterminator LicT n=1 Tax=Floccifex sp. TaxID=2815810 RepID=UPI002A75BB21|nr:PRD domain-containing protein [Floccifex sp.]MDD7281060.1 PRD domain-containing protein [Erysipelotrichaceae bacterium]MDY2957356.1 PRD domain-containing protein [Floccifex sp.]
MIIKKIFNNNVVVVENNGKDEVVSGRGIAFSKKVGDAIDESRITQIFVLKEENMSKFQEITKHIPVEIIDLTCEIIEMVRANINQNISDIIYISLSDHIYEAIKRAKEGIYLTNSMSWEISRYYSQEHKLGIKALEMINKKTGAGLKEDEASFIALHIVNAETENSYIEETLKATEIIKQILKVVRNYYETDFSSDSVYYDRFITHIKFFAQRLVYNKTLDDKDDAELLDIVKMKYKNSYNCVENIAKMLKSNYEYSVSDGEKLYLTIHIHRIVHCFDND